MVTKQCAAPECTNMFEPRYRSSGGRPHLYCSPKCRNRAKHLNALNRDPEGYRAKRREYSRRRDPERLREWRHKRYRELLETDPVKFRERQAKWARSPRGLEKTRAAALLRSRKAQAYDLLYQAIVPWWDEVKKSLQDRGEIPAPPEFTDIEEVA